MERPDIAGPHRGGNIIGYRQARGDPAPERHPNHPRHPPGSSPIDCHLHGLHPRFAWDSIEDYTTETVKIQ